MTENERLTFETELGISIDKNEDCPTMSICWNCDIPPRKCNYFKDAIDKLAKYEAIGTVEEFKTLKEKSVAKKVVSKGQGHEADCYCPNCNAFLGNDQDFCFSHTNYCTECGQALET